MACIQSPLWCACVLIGLADGLGKVLRLVILHSWSPMLTQLLVDFLIHECKILQVASSTGLMHNVKRYDDVDMNFFKGIYHRPHWIKDDHHFRDHIEELIYFFDDHDFDQNARMDALELLKAMYHEELHRIDDLSPEELLEFPLTWNLTEATAIIDRALAIYDDNQDGYFTWAEFRVAALKMKLVDFEI
ncbi:hypothetical protein CAPTEDRAFT_188396 [Capitella teleta]|uniref:EF-hand domain-containing protein n=1 Tax=Capitella teleta TaxID=283909 RepID=R7TRN4_CAPTE|nr:hypothetical protein CAPTEDRAFT_188396 [Capitella teleta]|eukprot:ELT96578.1 hypothetical protein CAPTEDRAFT_188396 [Capitella teleta]